MQIYMCEYRQGKKTIYHYLNTSLLYNNQVSCSNMTAGNGWQVAPLVVSLATSTKLTAPFRNVARSKVDSQTNKLPISFIPVICFTCQKQHVPMLDLKIFKLQQQQMKPCEFYNSSDFRCIKTFFIKGSLQILL